MVVTLPVWVSLGIEYQKALLGSAGHEFFFTQLKKKGEGNSRASFAYYEGITSFMGYTRSSTSSCLYKGTDICCVDQVIRFLLFILGHRQFFVYTRSSAISSFIPGHQRFLVYTRGEVSYSDQWPRCGERFFDR